MCLQDWGGKSKDSAGRILPLLTLLLVLLGAPCLRAQDSPAGNWTGSIQIPGFDLKVVLKLSETKGKGWGGTLDIPAQGVKDFVLTNVVVSGSKVGFVLGGIPGNPGFKGEFSAAANTISGAFSQGGQTIPFKMTRGQSSVASAAPVSSLATPARSGAGLEGFWFGKLQTPLGGIRVMFRIKKEAGGVVSARFDSPDQGVFDIPVDSVLMEKDKLAFALSKIGAGYQAVLDKDRTAMAGDWQQGGQTTALNLAWQEKAPDFRRAQEPRPPFIYAEEPVAIRNQKADIKLAGTMTLPLSQTPTPAFILVTGSGAQDRNETIMGHKPFLILADHLARRGFAVLRMDDRGVGGSTGNLLESTDEDLAEDVAAQVEYLKTRKDVDPRRIGVIGHSEGATVGAIAAAANRDIALLVLLAGPGVSGRDLVVRQGETLLRKSGLPDDFVAKSRQTQEAIFKTLAEEKDNAVAGQKMKAAVADLLTALSADQKLSGAFAQNMFETQIRTALTPWFRHFANFDPRSTLEKVKCPVLALNGGRDTQVPPDQNLPRIADALKAGNNPDFKTLELPKLNHLFQSCETGLPAEYGAIEETISPTALDAISEWIEKRTVRK